MHWTKVHATLPQSSVWETDYHVRIVWTTMMALCGLDGICRLSEASVYRAANVKEEEAAEAIRILSSPDPKSKDPSNGGRRIKKVNGGFQLLNYFKYRQVKTPDQKASYMRDYMREYRKKNTKPKWKEAFTREANAAVIKQFPDNLPPDVKTALENFISYRHALATKSERKADAVRLNSEMVQSLFDATVSVLEQVEPSKVANKLENAIQAGYRSPNLYSLYEQ